MFKTDNLPHKRSDEEVIFMLRRDHVILFRLIIWYVFLLLVPLFIKMGALNFLNLTPAKGHLSSIILTLLVFLYYMFVVLFSYRSWLDYYLDAWVVTNHRILNIELEGLFNRTVSEHKLSRIQDVTTEQVGFMSHFFHFGNIHVQTAAAKQRFIFEEVSEPEKVAQKIVQLIEWNKKAYPEDQD